MHDGVIDGGGWVVMLLMMLLLWGGLATIVVWAVTQVRGDKRAPRPSDADEALALRFARGEIDADEFARRRELLHSR